MKIYLCPDKHIHFQGINKLCQGKPAHDYRPDRELRKQEPGFYEVVYDEKHHCSMDPGPIVICPVCGKKFHTLQQFAYMSGNYYCSRKCYDTLFEKCLECGQMNMAAKSNRIRHGEQMCDPCRNKKHGWVVVTIADPNAGRYHRRG